MGKSSASSLLLVMLLAVALLSPAFGSLPADARTRLTIDFSVVWYAMAVGAMLMTSDSEWRAGKNRSRTGKMWSLQIRPVWTLAWMAYLVHLIVAFNDVHHWSHADAFAHTQERSGFGYGIYLSHFFTIVWGLDVAWWWIAPASYERRPASVGWGVHSFLAFMFFNGVIVFESGLIRWVGIAAAIVLGILFIRYLKDKKRERSLWR
jgi:hypothetical protein